MTRPLISFRNLLITLLLALSTLGRATTVTTSTKIIDPFGQPFTGTLTLQLPFAGVLIAGGGLVIPAPVSVNVVNGLLASTFTVPGNDTMSPVMPYGATFADPFGTPVTRQFYYITGTTFDLGSAPAVPNFINTTAVSGVGGCTNQFIRTLNSIVSPTCATVTATDVSGTTGSGNFVLHISPTFVTPNIGVASGTSLQTSRVSSSNLGSLITGAQAFLDMSNGTFGQGGMVQSTSDASSTTGYGVWITNNAYWDGTNWIQPRGTGTSSSGFTANNHKNFSFNHAAAGGVNGNTITWTEVANIDQNGTLLLGNVVHTATGTAAAPAYSFSLEPASGWFRQQSGIFGFSIANTYLTQYTAVRIGNAPGICLGWAPGAPNSNGDDITLCRPSAGVLGIGVSGNNVGGTLRVARNGAIRHAEDFFGADCGAKINAAAADIGANPGEIWVSQLCGTTISTAVSIPTLQTLRFVQGGTYSLSAAITLAQGSNLEGPGCGGNLCNTVLQAANTTNLPSMINAGNQSHIAGLAFDGNKTNNPTGGVGVKVSLTQHVRITNVLIQNFKSMGINQASTLAGDEANSLVLDNSMVFNNDGGGLQCANTTDGFMSKAQFENNGLGPQGGTLTTVNTSGTTVTWVSGPKWSTDTSLIGTLIRLNNSASTLFQVTAIASTTSLTVSATPGTLTGVNLYWGDGVYAGNCPGWRYEHSDFGGNGNDGLLITGSDTGRGSGQSMIVGNEFGGNRAHDFEKRGFGTAAFVATQNTISSNVFLGSATSIANTFSGMYMQDPNLDSITANIFSSANRKFGVDFEETAAGRAQKTVMTANSFAAGFGTAIYSTNTQLSTNALAIFANAEGPSGAISFGTGPSSIKFQGGVTPGTGITHFRQAATCTTAAAVNAQCTSTQTLPITMNDTNYSIIGCGLVSVTNALAVGWMGTKTTTTFQVVLVNAAGSAAAATGTLECGIMHD